MKQVMSGKASIMNGGVFMIERGKVARKRARGAAAGRIVAALAVVAMLGMTQARGVARADTVGTPMAVAKATVDRALAILANKSMPVVQRRKELREAIENNFDFTEMSRSALGYHWRSLTPAQRQDFTHLFTAFIEDAYLSKIQDYSGQKVEFIGQSQLAPGYVQISTNIVEPGKNPIAVNYLMLQQGGAWKIYDVTVDAISIIANYRNQFNRVINDQGFDKLMADLRSKQQELASLLGGTN
jgi:phospholipid transport system substrate-binding protein